MANSARIKLANAAGVMGAGSRPCTDRHFKRPFSATGTLSSALRTVNRVTIHASPPCFPQNLAIRCIRFASIRTLARAQAEPAQRIWPKPVRIRESSRLKKIDAPRRRARRRLSRQPQMRENALSHRGRFDRSDDLELAATHATE